MLRPRITPCLLLHQMGLVKTVSFKTPKYVGDPINAVKIFNEKEADELIILDIDATTEGYEPNYKLIANIAAECRMPLCYGGGIKTVEQAKKIISLGVEKISLSSAAIKNTSLITEITNEIGRQSVVVVLDVKSRLFGQGYDVFIHNGKVKVNTPTLEIVEAVVKAGAGELIINSIDNDGQMKGYDLNLAKKIQSIINIPITILGGAGKLDDIRELFKSCGVIGASAGSLFVFKGAYRAVLINYPNPDVRDNLIRSSLTLSL